MRKEPSASHFVRHNGAVGDWLLYGLIVVVMLLGGFAIFRSVDVQHRVATSFIGWYEDKSGHDKALVDMRQTHKPMLVYIYAPWCPHCKQFAAQVLSDPHVQQFVQGYPHVRITPDHGQAEQALMSEYGAKGYPSFYVVLPNNQKVEIATHTEGEEPRLKTPKEFMKSVLQATKGE